MPRGIERDWPSDDELVALCLESGSVNAAAKRLGCTDKVLSGRLDRQGIRQRVKDELAAARGKVRIAPAPGEPVSEEEILRARVAELERQSRQARKSDVFEERILGVLERASLERVPVFSPLAIPRSKRSAAKHEFVLLWSDVHAAEVVTREETNGINEYDWQIMLARHQRILESVCSYQDNRPYPVETLHVFGLGDMLSGNIHPELAETNEMPLAEATVQFGLDAAAWLEQLVPRFKHIRVSGVPGNHPRAHQKPRAKQAFDNADWTMYQTMRLALRRYPSVEFDIPKSSAWPVTVAERWRALLFHGDGIRSTMPGVPWGGVMRRVSALQDQYTSAGMPIDLFCLGHFHTANVVESSAGKVAMNGSVKGVDEYSLKQFGSGRGPQQLLLTYHPRNGLCDVSFIDCEDVRPAGESHLRAAA